MTHWLKKLGPVVAASPDAMHNGWILVPLTGTFAFISPARLVIVGPLLGLIPFRLAWAARANRVRRVPLWYGDLTKHPQRTATTALTFSSALREYDSFVYRPASRPNANMRVAPTA